MSDKELGIDLWEVWKMFETKKIFQIPKSKTDEISQPFSGGGPKMALKVAKDSHLKKSP